MKKILILTDINSAHTQRWVTAIAGSGFEVGIFTLSLSVSDWYTSVPNVKVLFALGKEGETFSKGSFSKIKYIKVVPELKRVIMGFQPDVLHAYYATSYGFIGALSKFHPFIISAWGSDVMDFPNKSFFHKALLKYNFKKADLVLATSNAIVDAIKKISIIKMKKIAFGIDLNVFKELKVESVFTRETIVIGTVKSLEKIYGIDILIKAFKQLGDKHPEELLKLLIVGNGSKELEYKNLVKELEIEDKVVFTGKVDFSKVPEYHNMIDIFINVSRNESFGVAVLEASACNKPIIASDIGGLKEVVVNNETGYLIQPENIDLLTETMEKLVLNKSLRIEMGEKGRKFVENNFDFSSNLKDTIEIYKKLIKD